MSTAAARSASPKSLPLTNAICAATTMTVCTERTKTARTGPARWSEATKRRVAAVESAHERTTRKRGRPEEAGEGPKEEKLP